MTMPTLLRQASIALKSFLFWRTSAPFAMRIGLSIIAICISSAVLRAQCMDGIDLGPDTTLCEGASLALSAGPGYQSYLWQDGSTGPNYLVTAPGTYQCTVTAFGTSGELVVNGNFSAGTTGFTSAYTPGTGGSYGPLSFEGTYAVVNSPAAAHSNFASYGDHTTGNGAMLVVNGASAPGQAVWCQTVAVAPNTNYAFSAWLSTAYFESPAQLLFTINGVPVGNPLLAPAVTGQWVNFYAIWNSGANTSASICITNQNTSVSGNDFALDDISFAPFCTYTDQITVTYQDFPEPDLGPDVVVCAGTPVLINAAWPNADAYAWHNGSAASTLAPAASGICWVDVTENGCTARDSILVTFTVQPDVNLGPDQVRCEGETAVLNAFFPGSTYAWSTGGTAASITVSNAGQYSVVVDAAGCTATDSVSFTYHPLPIVSLGSDTLLCADDVLTQDVERTGGSYLWSDGTTLPQNTLAPGSTHWVRVTELGCSTSDSITIGTIALPAVDLGPDFLLCKGLTHELDAFGPGCNYLWNTGDTIPEYTVTDAGIYGVLVSNACGAASDSVVVRLDQCDCPVFVPNAFTANNDARNDGFRPRFDCPYDEYLLQVFNRWGELIWQSTDADQAWDGGGGIADGVYVWRLRFRPITVYEQIRRELVGHVVLLR
jgi:gliding motility-associated-like protein